MVFIIEMIQEDSSLHWKMNIQAMWSFSTAFEKVVNFNILIIYF